MACFRLGYISNRILCAFDSQNLGIWKQMVPSSIFSSIERVRFNMYRNNVKDTHPPAPPPYCPSLDLATPTLPPIQPHKHKALPSPLTPVIHINQKALLFVFYDQILIWWFEKLTWWVVLKFSWFPLSNSRDRSVTGLQVSCPVLP